MVLSHYGNSEKKMQHFIILGENMVRVSLFFSSLDMWRENLNIMMLMPKPHPYPCFASAFSLQYSPWLCVFG